MHSLALANFFSVVWALGLPWDPGDWKPGFAKVPVVAPLVGLMSAAAFAEQLTGKSYRATDCADKINSQYTTHRA